MEGGKTMSKDGINERIIKGIKECSADKDIANFLIELLYEEAEHAGSRRWWKDPCREKIEQYSKDWGESHED